MEQVPNLDYTEASFNLEVEAADDKSLVNYTYSVGTSPGASDVVDEAPFNGPSELITAVSGQYSNSGHTYIIASSDHCFLYYVLTNNVTITHQCTLVRG